MIVDYDDAVFHYYDKHRLSLVRRSLGKKIDTVMRRADMVLAGNDYLASRARQAGARRIELLPTVVDLTRYEIKPYVLGSRLTIGWIGTPKTTHYLRLITPVLQALVASHGVRVIAVGGDQSQLGGIPVESISWSEASEVANIQQFDIGIMPLPDEPFERGKCGYKLIQYMACGKPVVASPVGVNSVIVRHGVEGFLATSEAEWINAIRTLCDDPTLRQRMGVAGRQRVESGYSLQAAAPRIEQLLRAVASKSCVG